MRAPKLTDVKPGMKVTVDCSTGASVAGSIVAHTVPPALPKAAAPKAAARYEHYERWT